jgi:hypothetical protein
MVERLNKKSLLYLGIVIFAGLLSLFLIWHFSKMPEIEKEIPLIEKEVKKEKTLEEILRNLTAPQATATPQVSKKVIKSLTAPKEKGVSEDIIKNLTAPE